MSDSAEGCEKLLIVIVTHNPDIAFMKKNIGKIRADLRLRLMIIDNHSRRDVTELRNYMDHFICFAKNYGLGRAYNYAFKFAKTNSEDYVLFLDQDASILDNFDPISVVEQASRVLERPVIVGINPITAAVNGDTSYANFYLVKSLMNSGMIVRVDYGLENPFLEELFLDSLDAEYCFRAWKDRHSILVYKEPMITHKPGEGYWMPRGVTGGLIIVLKSLMKTAYVLTGKVNAEQVRIGWPFELKYSNSLRYYLMLRNNLFLAVRRMVPLGTLRFLAVQCLLLINLKGVMCGGGLVLRAIAKGLTGRLTEDNQELFYET